MTTLERECGPGALVRKGPLIYRRAILRKRRALVVGSGPIAVRLAAGLEQTGRYVVVGLVDDVDAERAADWEILGGRGDAARLAAEHDVDEICVAHAPNWQQQLMDELAASGRHVAVRVVPTPFEALMRHTELKSFGDIALIGVSRVHSGPREWVKRVFDVFFSALGLVLLSPLLLLIAAAMKLTMPGRIIFAQERVGRHGQPFTLYKLRTMIEDAEAKTGPVLAAGKRDPRLTPLGRWLRLFRLDEIPQLWNVLRGDMSLVGPRPERPCFVDEYARVCPSYALRHRVRPGITGLAQVEGGYHTEAQDKLRFDLIYASQQCLSLDLWILARTLLVCALPGNRHG